MTWGGAQREKENIVRVVCLRDRNLGGTVRILGSQDLRGSFFISSFFLYGKRYADTRDIREDARIRLPMIRNLWMTRKCVGLWSSRYSSEGEYKKSLDSRICPETTGYGLARFCDPDESAGMGRIGTCGRFF